ncbi:16S rRNA methyltransferase G [Desulfuribacillus alkaliarsenatis]|uniref:Ribosomal RNA small subunit methyltransferase G n=1 Tax=Desulfuribacillus alkaliarsenatis TaxID=766136 RepID=A0A1E5G3A8_9FIRM|nr:16S rRNA methyltransferase G [Desulfuribacillus alkaliarsenatis]
MELTTEQIGQFNNYYKLLIDWNEKINLTAITEPEEVFYKHFYDSLTLLISYPTIKGSKTMIDIGSGAGFPGIPIKILLPELQITFMDSLNKRIKYLQIVANELGLKNCSFVHGRAEELGHKPEYREQFDYAVARAVARLAVLNEYCLPFVKNNGKFYSMKGPDVENEIIEAKKSLNVFNAKLKKTIALELPYQYGNRAIIEIQKIANMPKKYPRKAGTPAKSPII